ncbi:hemin uptake protein HemP [Methyloferula stellata]|uniref:hemin uptake protein HemP n=1 Tax=Methyloferula stellata TaxID=876270 RepID=UPI00037B1A75|nr:hemin uptake protein HemP [Methyloferula stellata]
MAGEKADETSASKPEKPKPDVPVINVRDLLADSREAVLIHEGERYRLRITAKDKLILTK